MAVIYGTSGPDSIGGTAGDDDIWGFGGSDLINAGAGNDFLIGGGGNDDLIGGLGFNDYWGEGGFDWFIMRTRTGAGASNDLIHDFTFDVDQISVVSWGISDFTQIQVLLTADSFGDATLNAYYAGLDHVLTVEQVAPWELVPDDFVFSGAGGQNQTGTVYADVMFGSRYSDLLNGAAGDDLLLGGRGDDLLIGGFGVDYFHGGLGFDEINFSYTNEAITVDLRSNWAIFASGPVEYFVSIEDLTGGGGSDSLTGNTLANYLAGGNGNDVLDGWTGADYLIGGNGANAFKFDSPLGGGNIDTIGDFFAPADVFWLDDAVFTMLTPGAVLPAFQYAEGNFTTARDPFDRIIYNNNTGGVFYDSDGIGGAPSIRFAAIGAGMAGSLSNADFFII